MKKWMKISLPAGAAMAVGLGAFTMFGELNDEAEAHRDYRNAAVHQTEAKTVHNNRETRMLEVEGKVTDLTKNEITIDVPFQGKQTFVMDKQTKIKEKYRQPLVKGAIAEIEANGQQAYEIETEKKMETDGTIVKVTDQAVTIDQNGKKETFAKAANFRIDADGYKGALEGVPAEVNLNAKSQIVELEIDLDDDGDDD